MHYYNFFISLLCMPSSAELVNVDNNNGKIAFGKLI